MDEEATVYIRSAREFGSLNLLPPVLAQASADIEAAIQQACQLACHMCTCSATAMRCALLSTLSLQCLAWQIALLLLM